MVSPIYSMLGIPHSAQLLIWTNYFEALVGMLSASLREKRYFGESLIHDTWTAGYNGREFYN